MADQDDDQRGSDNNLSQSSSNNSQLRRSTRSRSHPQRFGPYYGAKDIVEVRGHVVGLVDNCHPAARRAEQAADSNANGPLVDPHDPAVELDCSDSLAGDDNVAELSADGYPEPIPRGGGDGGASGAADSGDIFGGVLDALVKEDAEGELFLSPADGEGANGLEDDAGGRALDGVDWPSLGAAAAVADNSGNRSRIAAGENATLLTGDAKSTRNPAGRGRTDRRTRGDQLRVRLPAAATTCANQAQECTSGDRQRGGLSAAAAAAAATSERPERLNGGRFVFQSGANPRGTTCHAITAVGVVLDGHRFTRRQIGSMDGTVFGQLVASSNGALDPRVTDSLLETLDLDVRQQHDLGDVLNRLSTAVDRAAGIHRRGEGVEQTREEAHDTLSGWLPGTQMRTAGARYCANPSCETGWTPSAESALVLNLHDEHTGKARQPLTLGSLLNSAYKAETLGGRCPREGCTGRQVTQRFHAMGDGRIVATIARRLHDRYLDNKVGITQTARVTDVTGATWKYKLRQLVLWHPAGQVRTCMDASTWDSHIPGNGNRGGHFTILIWQYKDRWMHYNDGQGEPLAFRDVAKAGRRVAAATWLRVSRVDNGTADLHEDEPQVFVHEAGEPDSPRHMDASSVLDRLNAGRHKDTDVIGFADDEDNRRLMAAEWCDSLSRNNTPTDVVRHHRWLYIVSQLANRPAAPWRGVDSNFARSVRGDAADGETTYDGRRDDAGDMGGDWNATRDGEAGASDDAGGTAGGDNGFGLPTMEEIAANTLHSGGWHKSFREIPTKLSHEVIKRMTALLGSLVATRQESDYVLLTLFTVCLQRFLPTGAGKRKAAQNKKKLEQHVAECCDAFQGKSKAATIPAIMALYHKLWPAEQRGTREARARKQNARKAAMPDWLQEEDMKLSLEMALSGEYNKAMRALGGARPAKWGGRTTSKMRAKHGQDDVASDVLLQNACDALAEKQRQIHTEADGVRDSPMPPDEVASAPASLNVVKTSEPDRRRRTNQTAREKKKAARKKKNAKKNGTGGARTGEAARRRAEQETMAAADVRAKLRVVKKTHAPAHLRCHHKQVELSHLAAISRHRRAAKVVMDT
jgi:hypothetical protein